MEIRILDADRNDVSVLLQSLVQERNTQVVNAGERQKNPNLNSRTEEEANADPIEQAICLFMRELYPDTGNCAAADHYRGEAKRALCALIPALLAAVSHQPELLRSVRDALPEAYSLNTLDAWMEHLGIHGEADARHLEMARGKMLSFLSRCWQGSVENASS